MKKNERNGLHKIILRKEFSPSLFLLRIERNETDFVPGQYFYIGLPDGNDARAYSVYSGKNDPWLDFLIQKVDTGTLSPAFYALKQGDTLFLEGPKGYFQLPQIVKSKTIVFVATGTGIAPFHSMIQSYAYLDYRLLYGVRSKAEAIDLGHYRQDRLLLAVSQDVDAEVKGRVTDYIENYIFPNALFYLCGSQAMIKDVSAILISHGVPVGEIKTEIFY